MTTGVKPFLNYNNQAEKKIAEIERPEKYSQKNVYIRIVYNSVFTCVCVCVCVCEDYIYEL